MKHYFNELHHPKGLRWMCSFEEYEDIVLVEMSVACSFLLATLPLDIHQAGL